MLAERRGAGCSPEPARASFDEALAAIAPYRAEGRFQTFVDGADPVPGLGSILRAGHTPGHSSIVVADGGARLVIWGDITHGEVVQFADPDVTIDFDVDQPQARTTRRAALAEAAAEGYLVAGAHIAWPGIGRVRRRPRRASPIAGSRSPADRRHQPSTISHRPHDLGRG
ncbi:MBL fold metallo-hydrolase [Tistrella bauzanensis]